MGKTQIRSLTSLVPVGSNTRYGCHNPDVTTLVRGLIERVYFVQGPGHFVPTPQPVTFAIQGPLLENDRKRPSLSAFDNLMSKFRNRIVEHMPPTTRATYDAFLAHYTGRKLKLYTKAVESLRVREVDVRDSYLSTFVKIEKIDFTAKPDPAPRVIQPRSPRYNVELGRFLKPIEKPLYRAIDTVFGGPVVVKGMNASQRGRLISNCWNKFRDPVAVGLDAKRFDQHVSVDALKYEHSVYLTLFHRHPLLKKLLLWQIKNRGYANCFDGDVKYNIDGCRMSGDMNTSLGNVLLMCAMMWSYLDGKKMKYRFINDGDDCILIVERRDLARLDDLVDWFLLVGFEMERDAPVDILERIVFCQCQPVFGSDGHYRMMRDPRTCTAKDSITTKALREWEFDGYRKNLSECGVALAGDRPILGAFYDCLGRQAVVRNKRANKDDKQFYMGLALASRGMHHKRMAPTPATRSSFFTAFDITPDRQVSIEREYDAITIGWSPIEDVLTDFEYLPFMRF